VRRAVIHQATAAAAGLTAGTGAPEYDFAELRVRPVARVLEALDQEEPSETGVTLHAVLIACRRPARSGRGLAADLATTGPQPFAARVALMAQTAAPWSAPRVCGEMPTVPSARAGAAASTKPKTVTAAAFMLTATPLLSLYQQVPLKHAQNCGPTSHSMATAASIEWCFPTFSKPSADLPLCPPSPQKVRRAGHYS